MKRIVLLGDSIFDNGVYVNGGPDVIEQLNSILPDGWKGTLLAVDGNVTTDVISQIAALPETGTHLVVSAGETTLFPARRFFTSRRRRWERRWMNWPICAPSFSEIIQAC